MEESNLSRIVGSWSSSPCDGDVILPGLWVTMKEVKIKKEKRGLELRVPARFP